MISAEFRTLLITLIVVMFSSCVGDGAENTETPVVPEQEELIGLNFWKNHQTECMTIVTGATSILSVVDKFDGERYRGSTPVPGVYTIAKSITTDLDGDDLPEIMVLLMDRDMNSPLLKCFTNKARGRLLEIPVPNLPMFIYENYQGGDELKLVESSINHSVNYMANGKPAKAVFVYSWDAEKEALTINEQR